MSRQAAIAAALLLAAARWAAAAGGAHLVDDAAVGAPGSCQIEAWASAGSGDSSIASVVPACTPASLPRVEIGAFAGHARAPGSRQTVIGLAPKAVLHASGTGVGVALSGALGWDTGSSRVAAGAVNVPLTLALPRDARLHVNAGWAWARGAGGNALSGVQVEVPLAPTLEFMVEAFRRNPGRAGAQAGLRWTSGGGRVDVDILLGRYVDGATRTAATLGIALRH